MVTCPAIAIRHDEDGVECPMAEQIEIRLNLILGGRIYNLAGCEFHI